MAEQTASAGVNRVKPQDRGFVNMLKTTYLEWTADRAFDMAAALAYFAFLSLAPTLVILLQIVSVVYGEAAAEGRLVAQLEAHMGPQAAAGIQELLKNAHMAEGGTFATILSIGALLVSATGLVAHLKRSMNHMWNVVQRPGLGIKGFFRDRVIGVLLILTVGFILLASMVISTLITGMTDVIERALTIPPIAIRAAELIVSGGIITVLFAIIYKFLPDVHIRWKSVWVGAVVTAALFVIGKYLLGLYLGRGTVGSSYGAAGSLVVLLIWIYYSSLIFFMGAEFTQVYSRFKGDPVKPAEHAIPADSPEALAMKPHVEKTVRDEPKIKSLGDKGDDKAVKKRANMEKVRERQRQQAETQDKLAVLVPPLKERGSLVGGVISFLMVRTAARIARPSKPKRREKV